MDGTEERKLGSLLGIKCFITFKLVVLAPAFLGLGKAL